MSDRRRHVEPQWKYVFDEQGKMIVDKIIRFERLSEEIGPVFQRIFGEVLALPHINASKDKKDFHSFYDEETRAFVEALYRKDIDLFDYSFDH